MFKKLIMFVLVVLVGISASACIIFIKNGDELIVKEETSCWQCPKGANLTRLDTINNCINQTNWGSIAEGDVVVVNKGNNWFPVQSGFVRANASVFAVNPFTNESFDLGQRICWIDISDLKK